MKIQSFVNQNIEKKSLSGNDNSSSFGKRKKYKNIELSTNVIDKTSPIKAKGRLINTPFYMAPVEFVKDTGKDIVNVKNALVTGEASDNDLGKMNDLALKLGSLGIAGYLFTKRNTSARKMMEFVGFGTFLASMALWPKIFIQKPIELVHGANVFQKYESSQGEKKVMGQDPQYWPWDIYTPQEMDKLGDKVGIPKNIKNRSDYTKEKVEKLTLQANTLWMLSAGLGTPIMGAMAAAAADKYLTSAITENIISKNSEKHLKNTVTDAGELKTLVNSTLEQANGKTVKQVGNLKFDTSRLTQLDKLLEASKDKEITDETISKMVDLIVPQDNSDYKNAVNDALNETLQKTENHKYVSNLSEIFSSSIKKNSLDGSTEAIKGIVDYYNSFFDNGVLNTNKIKEEANNLFKNNDDALLIDEKQSNKLLKNLMKNKIDSLAGENAGLFNKIFSNTQASVLDDTSIKNIIKLQTLFSHVNATKDSVNKYLEGVVGDTGESLTTLRWQQINQKFLKSFGFNEKELNAVKAGTDDALKIIDEKMVKIAGDDSSFKKVMEGVSESIKSFDEYFGFSFLTNNNEDRFIENAQKIVKERFGIYDTLIDEIFKDTNIDKNSLKMLFSNNNKASINNQIVSSQILQPLQNKQASFYKMIMGLDFYKRVQDGSFKSRFEQLSGQDVFKTNKSYEEILDLAKKAILADDINSYLNKLNIDIQDGKGTYRIISELLFNSEFSESTKAILESKQSEAGKSGFINNISDYARCFYNNISNYYNHEKRTITPNMNMSEQDTRLINATQSPIGKSNILGDTLVSMLKKGADNASNTRNWFKLFGTLGGAVAAITVLSTLFFGKIQLPNENKRVEGQSRLQQKTIGVN